jgi:hypothetical protein
MASSTELDDRRIRLANLEPSMHGIRAFIAANEAQLRKKD